MRKVTGSKTTSGRWLATFHTTLGFDSSSMDLKRMPIYRSEFVHVSAPHGLASLSFNIMLMIYASKYILHRVRYVALSRIALTSMLVSAGGRSSFSNNGKLHGSIVVVDEL